MNETVGPEQLEKLRGSRPVICGILSNSGPNGEPLACGYTPGHDGPHSWGTLPTWGVKAPSPDAQIDRLAACILRLFPYEPGKHGDETAVDVAIRLIEKLAEVAGSLPPYLCRVFDLPEPPEGEDDPPLSYPTDVSVPYFRVKE